MRVITKSQPETEDLGFKLGRRLLKAGEPGGIVFLYGDIGAGKTAFVKGIASALNIPKRDVGSASFVIVAEYETSPPFYHIDLYRAEKENDIEALGIWEYIDSGGIAVIEWAERLPPEAQELYTGVIKVKINYIDEYSREIIIDQ